jgi:phosphohistidine phosphatase
MRILVVRHGDAGDAERFARSGRPDHLRPLTARGRKRMWLAARALVREAPRIDLLATSPYVRAVQTAEVLSQAYGELPIQQIPQLEPGVALDSLFAWLDSQSAHDGIALVGHAPDLADLVTCLAGGTPSSPAIKIKKGGACLVTLDGAPSRRAGVIRWLMDAGQLGKLGS